MMKITFHTANLRIIFVLTKAPNICKIKILSNILEIQAIKQEIIRNGIFKRILSFIPMDISGLYLMDAISAMSFAAAGALL